MSSGYFDKYYSMFYLDTGGSSLAPPPFQPHPAGGFDAFVSYLSVHEGPYPFYPASAFGSFSGALSSTAASGSIPSASYAAAPPPASDTTEFAVQSIFGPPPPPPFTQGMLDSTLAPLSEITVPDSTYLISPIDWMHEGTHWEGHPPGGSGHGHEDQ